MAIDTVSGQSGEARFGGVAAGNPQAVAAGMDALQSGGNAFDALIATAFTMGVVEPLDCGLGGGGFAILYRGADRAVQCIDFMSTSPVEAHYELYQTHRPQTGYEIGVRNRANEVGHRAVAVPGAAAGLLEIHRRYAALPLIDDMHRAITLARDGYVLGVKPIVRIERTREVLQAFPQASALFLHKDGSPPSVGERWRNPDYAQTLETLAQQGSESFYRGAIASAIVDEMRRGDGFITPEDLADYRVLERAPAGGAYAHKRIASMPAPACGALLLRGLNALASRCRGSTPVERGLARAQAMLTMFEERGRGLGDPGFEGNETTSISTIDCAGNAAVMTYSLNLHSGVVPPDTGMLLNNQMLLFNPWQNTPNSIAAGKRPASSMTPTLVLDDNGVTLAIGASGSTRIASALLQVIDARLIDGRTLRESILAERIHAEAGRLLVDESATAIGQQLAPRLNLNLDVLPGRDSAMGSVQAVARIGFHFEAMGDPRSGGMGRVQ